MQSRSDGSKNESFPEFNTKFKSDQSPLINIEMRTQFSAGVDAKKFSAPPRVMDQSHILLQLLSLTIDSFVINPVSCSIVNIWNTFA